MPNPIITKLVSIALRAFGPPYARAKGNVLVYLIVVILIFGVLGVTIVSLFTTATSSSATPNNARRAYYIAESGVRFASSRIKAARFRQDYISEINNTAQYTLANGDSFAIDIFSPWFISATAQSAATNNPFTLEVPNDGKIPKDFSIPDTNVFLVSWDTFKGGPPPIDSYAQIIASSASAGATSLTITMGNTPVLAVDAGQTVCLAVQPVAADASSPLQAGEDIYIAAEAKLFFPPRNGAIRIVTADNQAGEYYYEELVDESTQVRLTNLAPMPQTSFVEITDFSTDDWVVLSRYNYRVITTGKSGDVTSQIGLAKPVWVFPNADEWTISEREFIDNAVLNVTGEPIIKTSKGVTENGDQIQFGDDTDTDAGFGTIWYGGDKSIEDDSDRCLAGRCLFDEGIRAFFTLDYSGDGEGFVFALIAAANYPTDTDPPINSADSAGGDAERSELLGYAGDSRQDAAGTSFLDGSTSGKGLLPPKMGIEFDTRTNFNGNFEQTLVYCNGASLNPDTRNDPRPGDNPEDAVQYVFWGSETIGVAPNPSIACRDNDSTYDDNKHDADDIFEKWRFDTGGNVWSSPAVDTNVTEGIYGRVYVGSESHFFYGLNPADRLADGTEQTLNAENEWKIDTRGTLESNAAVGDDGMVYIGAHGGSGEGLVYAMNPASRLAGETFPYLSGGEWRFSNATIGGQSNVWTSPAIDDNGTRGDTSDDTIYIGDDDGVFYAFPAHNGTPKWMLTHSGLAKVSAGRPALAVSSGRKKVYITGRDSGDRTLFALDASDRQAGSSFPNTTDGHEWTFNMGVSAYSMPGVDPGNGRIYSAGEGNRMVCLSPTGTEVWPATVYNLNSATYSTPVTDDGGVVYVLPWDGKLHAINTNGSTKWTFQSGGTADSSNPTIGPDATVYFGSLDGRLYAVGHDGESTTGTQKYNFNTFNKVYTTPAIDPRDETVYIGSDSNYLHAINQLAEPRSYRDDSVEANKLVSSADFSGITFADTDDWLQGPIVDGTRDGTWAIRIEVTYDGMIDSQDQYTLKTWVEKCTNDGCAKFLNSKFRDTLSNYKVANRPPKLDQTITLMAEEHAKFERFLFGFTSAAASGDTQAAIIKFFELTFIRDTDPDVTSDPNLDS